jgi:NhaP-type Na+/H+ or K+/H+ antiporter
MALPLSVIVVTIIQDESPQLHSSIALIVCGSIVLFAVHFVGGIVIGGAISLLARAFLRFFQYGHDAAELA